MTDPVSPLQPTHVESSHRGVTLHYPGKKWFASMDMAVLRTVRLLEWREGLYWQLVSAGNELVVPCGIPGESAMRRELQGLPGFQIDLFFAYLDERSDLAPPLTLWQK